MICELLTGFYAVPGVMTWRHNVCVTQRLCTLLEDDTGHRLSPITQCRFKGTDVACDCKRKKDQYVPFVFLSGTIGEEIAVMPWGRAQTT